MNYEELSAELKEGKIRPFYLFYGAEEFLIEHCINEIKKKLVEPWAEMMNFKSYNEVPDINEATDFMETLPVMSERKLAVFRKCGIFGNIKNKAQWEEAFSAENEFNCVIIWEDAPEKGKALSGLRKTVSQKACVVEFALRTEAKLKPWLVKLCQRDGKVIDEKNAVYLISSLGRKMGPIKTELAKIIAYSKGEQITREDIDSVIIKPSVSSVFNLIDAIFEGKRKVCYDILYKLRQNKGEPVALLSTLSGQLINIYKAKALLSDGLSSTQVAREIGFGYVGENSVRKAQKLKVENIASLIFLCREGDANIKKGLMDGWSVLDSIVAEYKFY